MNTAYAIAITFLFTAASIGLCEEPISLFNGKNLSIVDAAYAPFLMRFTIVEPFCKTGIMEEFPYVEEWRKTLIKSPIVKDSLPENFMELFKKKLVEARCLLCERIYQ